MPRLYHKKSKNGCVRCRERRVKCDEKQPSCSHCCRHEVECRYEIRPKSPKSTTSRPSKTKDRRLKAVSIDPFQISQCETAERRLLELKLHHIYLTEVCYTLPGAFHPVILEFYRVDIVKHALDFRPLHNAILAITALYLVKTQPHHCIPGLQIHQADYLEAAIQEHRELLEATDPTTAENVALTTAMLSTDYLLTLGDRSIYPYQPPVQWFYLSQGGQLLISRFLGESWEQSTSALAHTFRAAYLYWDPAICADPTNVDKFPYLVTPLHDENWTDLDAQAYSNAAAVVGSIAIAAEAGETMEQIAYRVSVFPACTNRHFLDLVDRHDGRALVILAHLFALASFAEIWWVGNGPVREVLAIANHLDAKWQPFMDVPLQWVSQDRSRGTSCSSL